MAYDPRRRLQDVTIPWFRTANLTATWALSQDPVLGYRWRGLTTAMHFEPWVIRYGHGHSGVVWKEQRR